MAMALSAGGRRRGPLPVMNVTPLVDVALVVLIIFMGVTPLMTKTLWIHVPTKDDPDKKEPAVAPPTDADKPLVMTVDEKGVIAVNKTVLTKQELRERLPRMLAAKTQKVLHFDAADKAPYGAAVEAMDISRQSGAKSIAVTTARVAR